MLHARPRTHDLNLAGLYLCMITHAVAVLDGALQHVTEDFHVAVTMRREAFAGRDDVLVDDTQGTETHVLRIVILPEAERMPGLEPAMVGVAALGGTAGLQFHLHY